jgi:hypothetical protein
VYGVHHIFDLIEPSRSRSTEACSNGGLLQLATVLGICARCAFSIGSVDAETIPERERERSGEERSGKRHLYLSLISSFRLTQMFISSNSCSLSLSLSFHLSRQATNPTTRSVLPPSVCTVHFSDPSVTSLLLARSPRLSLSLSLSTYTLQCKPRARRQASKTRGTEVAVAAGSGPSAT